MQTSDLTAIVDNFADCEIVAYADMETSVTLLFAAHKEPEREVLDQLCALAVLHLGRAATPEVGVTPPEFAVFANADFVHLFCRLKEEPSETLVFRCKPSVDLKSILASAQPLLRDAA